jgi:hypothetical protein
VLQQVWRDNNPSLLKGPDSPAEKPKFLLEPSNVVYSFVLGTAAFDLPAYSTNGKDLIVTNLHSTNFD